MKNSKTISFPRTNLPFPVKGSFNLYPVIIKTSSNPQIQAALNWLEHCDNSFKNLTQTTSLRNVYAININARKRDNLD